MDRLSSCYFCGGALDASLDEYPVVPPELQPSGDVQQTVVLCRGCRRKLDSVTERVVDAARTGPGPDDDGTADVESSLDGGENLLQSVGDADSETTDPGGNASLDEDSGEPEDDLDRSDQPASGDDQRPAGASGADTDSSPGGESGSAGGVESETSLTRLEYNRVMRLLQNREFPVGRAGFVNVAANAYEITPGECDKILDVAIDHGLIEERDGELVKPGED